MTSDLDIALLDRLAARSTIAPWRAVSDDSKTKDGPKYPTSAEVMIYSDSDCEAHPVADFSCNHTCRFDSDAEANARFVVALVNSWPLIRKRLHD